jgi:hypothetical protein
LGTADVSDLKVLTVILPETLVGGRPSHNLYPIVDDPPSSGSAKTKEFLDGNGGFWSDIVTDMGLPTSIKIPTIH